MMEKRELVCIGCPLGCQLIVETDGVEVAGVTGNTCKRGDVYARKDCNPRTRYGSAEGAWLYRKHSIPCRYVPRNGTCRVRRVSDTRIRQ